MADIKTTVNAMAKKDTSPVQPESEAPPAVEVSAVKIREIAKELAQPWIFGDALHRFARRHEVPIKIVREIQTALQAKQLADNPVLVEKPK